jgi:hypothetical protein
MTRQRKRCLSVHTHTIDFDDHAPSRIRFQASERRAPLLLVLTISRSWRVAFRFCRVWRCACHVGCAIRARRVFGDRLHHGLSPLLLLHACTRIVRSRHKKNGRLNVAHRPWISEETSRPLTFQDSSVTRTSQHSSPVPLPVIVWRPIASGSSPAAGPDRG